MTSVLETCQKKTLDLCLENLLGGTTIRQSFAHVVLNDLLLFIKVVKEPGARRRPFPIQLSGTRMNLPAGPRASRQTSPSHKKHEQ